MSMKRTAAINADAYNRGFVAAVICMEERQRDINRKSAWRGAFDQETIDAIKTEACQ